MALPFPFFSFARARRRNPVLRGGGPEGLLPLHRCSRLALCLAARHHGGPERLPDTRSRAVATAQPDPRGPAAALDGGPWRRFRAGGRIVPDPAEVEEWRRRSTTETTRPRSRPPASRSRR